MTIPRMTGDELLLENRVLALQTLAAGLDVTDAEARARSCARLTELFFALTKLADVQLFVEAGAKEAAASRRAAGELHVPTVIAFEANPFTYEHFRGDSLALPNMTYRHAALSDESGSVTFNVLQTADGAPQVNGRSSLLKRQSELERGFIEVEVPAVRLDDVCANLPGSAALWVDVEGATKPVLGGANEVLSRTLLALIEVEDRRFWGDEQWLSRDVTAYMWSHGLLPVARDFQSRYQFNYLYVRDDLLAVDRAGWLLTKFYSQLGSNAERSAAPRQAPSPTALSTVARLSRRARREIQARRPGRTARR